MNPQFQSLVDDFFQSKKIAVAGYSRDDNAPANAIFKKLADNGYEVYAVNPHADEIKEVKAWPDLSSLPEAVDALFVCGPPAATPGLMKSAAKEGIQKVWIHRSVDGGSYHPEAESIAQENGMMLIPFGCPMMFLKPDIFHRCMRWFYQVGGKFKT